jgi:hypothetical protein
MSRLSVTSVLFFVASAAFAQSPTHPSSSSRQVLWEPPVWTFDEIPNGTVPKQMLSTLRVAGVPVTLEDTKIEDVSSTLGGTIGQKGDAGLFEEWLCFEGTDPNGRWALWLESREIDGGSVGGFHWQRLNKNAVLDRRCRMLGETKVELPIAVRLGIAEAEVFKSLGRPTVRRGDSLCYVHEHQESIRGEPYDSTNIVVILLRAGRVWSIEASHTTTS